MGVLKEYFPMIKERNEILSEIMNNWSLRCIYEEWDEEEKNNFLNICSGTSGIKMCYDVFFKELLNPVTNPQRLESLLSAILNKKVKILHVFHNDAPRISVIDPMMVLDIVVELEDGTIANIEMQKQGYMFPAERASCYSADLLLRQYTEIKRKFKKDLRRDKLQGGMGEEGKNRKKMFDYKEISDVYVIVIFEKSPKEFIKFYNDNKTRYMNDEEENLYIHRFENESNTGLKLNFPQKFYFLSLDIYNSVMNNKNIRKEIEAWMNFFATDDPERIVQLISLYPEFEEMYKELFDLCKNVERVMSMYSEILAELDRNTAQYMVELMQKEIEENERKINEDKKKLELNERKIKESERKIKESERKIEESERKIETKDKIIEELKQKIIMLEKGKV